MNRHTVAGCCSWFLLALLMGCVASGKPAMENLYYQAEPRHPNLIVFLRGLGGTMNCFTGHKCFDKEGFVDAVRARDLPYDMIAPNAHFGYYRDRTLHLRLKTDVIDPARAAGYENIWLVGTSLGGLGTLLYLREFPEDIDGVLSLGPYVGDPDFVVQEIGKAGGVANWDPGDYDPEDDWPRMLWHFIKEHEKTGPDRAPIFLGLADDDPYYACQKVLADYLPPQRVIEVEGGHLLSTFKEIWLIFLDNQTLPAP